MSDPLATISTRRTHQSQQADPRQEKNRAGGYTFVVDDLARLHRFLTLGTTGGTYYASETEHTQESAQLVLDLARTRTLDVVNAVVAVSTAGRAPKQNPSLFALAAAAKLGDDDGRKAALAAVPLVARTGTHLFQLAGYLEQFGGWGRGTRRAIGNWYVDPERSVADVAYQAVKYRQREGWTHADLLRLAHPATTEPARRSLFDWISGRPADLSGLAVVDAFERLQKATSATEVADIIAGNRAVSWEMIPDQYINDAHVWEALLENGVPQTALMRQLPRLTRLGMLQPLGSWAAVVAAQLADPARLKKARVHPINVLVALRTYAHGISARGDSQWTPSRTIVDALDKAFYAAFGAVEPTGKRTLLALDASGSMQSPVSGLPLTCREAAAALAMVTSATEPANEVVAFTASAAAQRHITYSGGMANSHRLDLLRDVELTPLAISHRQRLDDVIRTVADLPWGRTDCALPMVHALRAGLQVDTFVIYTDNETFYGDIHPHQALQQYRRESGIDARLVVVAMTGTGSSIADPTDPGMLDVSGFDSAVPGLISDFSRGL
jgi:60 kDa SS-A/Ro ribonucleoprotein